MNDSGPEPWFGPESADQNASAGEDANYSADEARQVIVSGYISMTVVKPRDAADDIARIVEQAGGHIDSRTEIAPGERDEGRAELTVRVPSHKRVATIDKIEELGEVEESVTSRDDVTSVVRDLDARITALETSVDRLLTLMAEADNTTDLIAIESALSDRQANLESLQSQRRSLADQVDFSTITIFLGSEADAPITEPDTFLSGLVAGWEALVAFFAFVLVAFGVVLPWLIVPAIALLIVLWLVRRRRKRKAGRVPAQSQNVAGEPAPSIETEEKGAAAAE